MQCTGWIKTWVFLHLHESTLCFGGDCIRTYKLDSAPASVVVQYAPMTFGGRLDRPLGRRGASKLNNLM